MHIFCYRNLATMGIIHLILISSFIDNINTLIQLFPLFIRYMYLNLTSKNSKMTQVWSFNFDIIEYSCSALINRALVL